MHAPGEAPVQESTDLGMPTAGSRACSLSGKDPGQRETQQPQKIVTGQITRKTDMPSTAKETIHKLSLNTELWMEKRRMERASLWVLPFYC